MAVDLKAIDDRIRKLQKLRELLADEDTCKLIADPEVLNMLRDSVTANGNGNSASHAASEHAPESEDTDERLPAEGSLKRRVLDTARAFTGKFDIRSIVEQMTREGFEFGRDPMLSVNQAMRHLARENLVRLVRAGSGRQPNIYEIRRTEVTNRN